MRLIDADALKKQVIECDLEKPEKITFRWMISQQPTIDAVPVVRCKDCFWFDCDVGCPLRKSGYFKRGKPLPHEDDFCSYGERKDGE